MLTADAANSDEPIAIDRRSLLTAAAMTAAGIIPRVTAADAAIHLHSAAWSWVPEGLRRHSPPSSRNSPAK